MTNEPSKSSDISAETASFSEKITPLLTDLFYPSESDEPLEPVTWDIDQAEPLTVSQIKDWQLVPPATFVEERPEAEFWEPVITEQDWYGDDENARTADFRKLHDFITATLTNRQVFYVGETEIDVFLLGQLQTDEWAGIKTKVVQT